MMAGMVVATTVVVMAAAGMAVAMMVAVAAAVTVMEVQPVSSAAVFASIVSIEVWKCVNSGQLNN